MAYPFSADPDDALIPVDYLLHGDDRTFCYDMSCPCHEDSNETAIVGQYVSDGLMNTSEADRLYRGRTI